MISLTDTHCHLADAAFRHCLPNVITEAATAGVRRFIVPATQRADFQDVLALERAETIHIGLGIHPWFAESAAEEGFAELETLLLQHPHAWVGEIGLDFYDKNQTETQKHIQKTCFLRQLALAEKLRRPVIIHNLKATAAVVEAVKQSRFTQGGIAHAFSGSLEEAHMLTRAGFSIGIGSLLLNPTARKAREAAAKLPLESIVLETDSPFMLKNTVNTPANVREIAEITASLRDISVEEVARQTEENVDRLLAKLRYS
ncbi:TatD related DNAse [Neisseria zoodegmatis]|uniref:TatD related DNAse n=1 Tax=Neisseria zoodegmatis TaxID=326523 RepID=A0A378WFX8_9NEIS|nr:TatD related DNAse [Neisseria zoodegmatis]